MPKYPQSFRHHYLLHHGGKKVYFGLIVVNNSRLVFLGGRFDVDDFLYTFGNGYSG